MESVCILSAHLTNEGTEFFHVYYVQTCISLHYCLRAMACMRCVLMWTNVLMTDPWLHVRRTLTHGNHYSFLLLPGVLLKVCNGYLFSCFSVLVNCVHKWMRMVNGNTFDIAAFSRCRVGPVVGREKIPHTITPPPSSWTVHMAAWVQFNSILSV